jgi:hypothetical protein
MSERQLRNLSIVTGMEMMLQVAETDQNIRDVDDNVAGSIMTGDEQSDKNGEGPAIDEHGRSPDDQVNNPGLADDEVMISSIQFKTFM